MFAFVIYIALSKILDQVDKVKVGAVIWLAEPKIFDVTNDGHTTAPDVNSDSLPKYKLVDVEKNTHGCPALEVCPGTA